MKLEGSCHCGAVAFTVQSAHPYPFNVCYCTICRKTQGGGGHAINLRAAAPSLVITGEENISIYQARLDNSAGDISPAERRFCKLCGSGLWLWDPRWPELLHPFASAIDTDLPIPPERTHLMLGSAEPWASPVVNAPDKSFDVYPEESIAQWHERLGLTT